MLADKVHAAKPQSHSRASGNPAQPPLIGRVYTPEEALELFNANFLIGRGANGSVGIFAIKPNRTLDFMPDKMFTLLTDNLLVGDYDDPRWERYDGHVPGNLWWRGHPKRHTRTLVFKPKGDVSLAEWNLWTGFAITPKKGRKLMQPLLRHIKEIICRNNEAKFDYLIRWCAFAVQHPDQPAETVPVMKSNKQGPGKSTLPQVLCDIFGDRHSAMIDDKKRLLSNFNDWMEPMAFICGEEILFKNDHAALDRMKSMITGKTFQLERKYGAVWQVDSHLHMMLTSNHDLPVRLGAADRRYFVLDVAEDRVGDRAYWTKLYGALDAGGRAEFLHYLLTYPLGDWHPRDLLKTAEAVEAQRASAPPHIQWLQAVIDEEEIEVDDKLTYPLGGFVSTPDLYRAYSKFCRAHGMRADEYNVFGQLCTKFFGEKVRRTLQGMTTHREAAQRPWGYTTPHATDLARKIDQDLGT
jgi:hypothetical protein